MENYYIETIARLKDSMLFNDDIAQGEQEMLKKEIHKYIQENIEINSFNERISEELAYKVKEIEKYQDLVENYKKSIEESYSVNTVVESEKENSKSKDSISEYIFVDKIEKLEYDKLIINNILIEAKRELANLQLDRNILEAKLKSSEVFSKEEIDKLKSNLLTVENKYSKSEIDKNNFKSQNETLNKEINKLIEQVRHSDKLKTEINILNNQTREDKSLLEKLKIENKNLKINVNQLNKEIMNKSKENESKEANQNKIINSLKKQIQEYKAETEKADSNILNKFEISIANLNSKLWESQLINNNLNSNLDVIKMYLKQSEIKFNDINDYNQSLLSNIDNLDVKSFGDTLCLVLKA